MVQGTKGISITATMLIPDSELSDRSDPRMVTVTAAMLTVQEDGKAKEDEPRQTLSLKRSKTSARCRVGSKHHPMWRSDAREGYSRSGTYGFLTGLSAG